jgi:hypothetical protein
MHRVLIGCHVLLSTSFFAIHLSKFDVHYSKIDVPLSKFNIHHSNLIILMPTSHYVLKHFDWSKITPGQLAFNVLAFNTIVCILNNHEFGI